MPANFALELGWGSDMDQPPSFDPSRLAHFGKIEASR
jgi:hypothetical protein